MGQVQIMADPGKHPAGDVVGDPTQYPGIDENLPIAPVLPLAPAIPPAIATANKLAASEESFLDRIPESTWFFCFPLWFGVFCITVLGILHPLFWTSVMKVYRSELFVFMYVLVGFWSFLSCALVYAIFAESSCIYVFWIYYTFAFGATMAAMMFLLFCGFCILGMRRKSVVALLGVIYYLVTIYFVFIVNKQRKDVFGLQKHDCGECAERSASRFHDLPDIPINTTTRTRLTTTTKPTTTTALTTTTMTTTMTTTVTNTTMALTNSTINEIHAAPMAALLAADAATTASNPTHTWVVDLRQHNISPETPKTMIHIADMDQMAAIAKLSELLINSNECRKPRKPSHGRYRISARGTTTLRLLLRCDNGYRENSVETECRYNWWDRPIPQCRKRREPPPLDPGGACTMPGFPEHGEYTVTDHARARPGDSITGDNVILLVTCDEPYRAVDPYVICVEGRWRHAPPTCEKHCKLIFDPTVEYKCLKHFKDEFLACGAWQPDGTTVVASCKPGHAHRGPFRYMRCRGDAWDHVVSCLPNANFTT